MMITPDTLAMLYAAYKATREGVRISIATEPKTETQCSSYTHGSIVIHEDCTYAA